MTLSRVAIAVLVAMMLGCESRPHNPAAALAGVSAQNVMVLPLNVALTLRSELEGPSDRVWSEIGRYVRAHDKHVETVRFGDARRIWLDVVQQIESGEREAGADFDSAARLLVLELGQLSEFDAVIMPSIFIQQARLQGKSASWDRVKRRVEIEGDVRSIGSIMTSTSLHGDTPGASLHVVILDAHGTKLQEAQAGLELLERMKVVGKKGSVARNLSVVWERRPDLFDDESNVREGVMKALEPFLSPLPEAAK